MDIEQEKKLLLKRDAEWSALASEGKDIDAILSYWTDNAVVIPPGMPTIKGKDQLRRYIEDSFKIPGFKISWNSSEVEFSPDGNLAHMFSENEVRFNTEDGSSIIVKGRAVTIWRRENDGVWRCAVDIWNSEEQ